MKIYHLCMIMIVSIIICSCSKISLIDKKGNVINDIKHKTVIALWPKGTDGINTKIKEKIRGEWDSHYNIHNPSLTVYVPKVPNGTSIIVFPGGGYVDVAYNAIGVPTAEMLIEEGVTVFVLKYRLPNTKGVDFKYPVPLMDAQRAIKLVRYNAAVFGLNPNRIGIMGFSAGGHLASIAGTMFHKPVSNKDAIDKISCRPDFMMLIFPVITTQAKPFIHNCPENLISENSDPNLLKQLSTELNVTVDTPPTFLAHAKDDIPVPHQNSVLFYEALKKNGVQTDLKLYNEGGHFVGFFDKKKGCDALNWINDVVLWLRNMKFISK